MWKNIHIKSWNEFNELISQMQLNNWIYRGQCDTVWNLQSSLNREINNFHQGFDNDACVVIEKNMIDEYLSSSHLYSPFQLKEPTTDNRKEWVRYRTEILSIMQHYGTPTRLLDWTYSPYIATFFAVDGADDDFAIFALNIKELERLNEEHYGADVYRELKNHIFDEEIKDERFLFRFDPTQKNERIRKQQGLFIVPSVINKTIDEILSVYRIEDGKIGGTYVAFKYIFKKRDVLEYWHKLRQMNITHETIYPGFEGFCKSLKLNIFVSE
ncbi:FRG domain-containing protein [Chungangia koreensis]|uniref:FRG domain-containing protein n=1 Tax=Chungangia koreensis TaxID=752657 RepID=A0ABV8X1B0_9LACT